MPYAILVHELAAAEISALRAFDRRRVLDAIEEQLTYQPTAPTRRRKCLVSLVPAFEHVQPVWELRIGAWRVFYDVNGTTMDVHIRAVRRKDPAQHTKEIT